MTVNILNWNMENNVKGAFFMKIRSFMNKFVLLASQGFAAADCLETAKIWRDCVSAPGDTTINDTVYKKITTEKELAWLSNNINNNAILLKDLDMGGKLWIPIAAGKGDRKYEKVFDGQYHIIRNLYINGDELSAINNEYPQNLGFVGVLGNGTVRNLILENVDIHATTKAGDIVSSKDSQISVGAVVGWMSDKATTNVVDNCMASGTIKTTGSGQGVGGIVGNAKIGSISNCLSLVEIQTSGAKAYIGGIIGITKTNVTVSSCVYAGPGLVNTGANGSVGGVVGNVFSGKATATGSYFEGDLTYNGKSVEGVGEKCSGCTVKDTTQKVDATNADSVACALNGKNADGTCKEEPWSVGLTGLSLNGYGADGYKIIFNANEGAFAGNDVTKNIYLASGMTITDNEVGKPSRDGFSFEGWALTANATEPLENLGTVSKSTKFYAVWAPLNTIIFNVAPGSFSLGEQSKTKQVANGEVITVEGLGALPESYCSKYDTVHVDECATTSYFTGWALDSAAAVADTLSLDTVTASDGLTLYAVWDTVETYTVTYNANLHGMTTVDYVRVGAGDTVAAPTDPIADTGYVFDGWFTDAEGVNQYQFAAQIHESIILYAKWVLDTFTVAYEMNGVSNAGENPVFYTIETPTFALAAPADSEGYVFEGWFYDANFTNPASQLIQGTTGDKTFYAKWTKKKYRVMYLADNNSYGSISDQFVEYGSSYTLASAGIFRRAGYEQNGWSTTMAGTKDHEFGEEITVIAPVTLYPTWAVVTYTINYECDGCINNSQNPKTYTVNDQKNIKFPQSREGYRFGGWYAESNYATVVQQIKKGSVGDTTLYGKWNKIYKITYVGTDKPYCDSVYTVDDSISFRNPADSAGYTFGGWYDNANFEGDAVTGIAKGSTGDTTFYAKWIPESVETKYGAITVTETNSKVDGEIVTTRAAVINGNYGGGDEPNSDETDAVEITSDITVNSVTLNRTFNAGKIATLYVPFEIDAENVEGTEVYKFKTVVKSDVDNRWKFKVSTATKVMPNTPYVIIPEGTQVTFDITDPVTLNTTTGGEATAANNWEFVGAYQYEKFILDNNNPIYLFADQARDGAKLGEFVKIADGAHINPMRAYLVYHKSEAMQKSARGNFGSGIALPDELDIEIENENGIVVQTGTLNTVTGEVRMDRWFDLKGRKLNAKPTAKGTYYKNGKRVIIK